MTYSDRVFIVSPFGFPRIDSYTLCEAHFQDSGAELGCKVRGDTFEEIAISNPNSEYNSADCVNCQAEHEEYEDGDYPGVERDEMMERVEGYDFWNE